MAQGCLPTTFSLYQMQDAYLPKEAVKSFHSVPGAQKSLIYFYSTIISTPSDSHRAVPSYRGFRPSFPQDNDLPVLQPLSSLGGQFRFSPRSQFHTATFIYAGQALGSAVHGPVMLTPSALSPASLLTPVLTFLCPMVSITNWAGCSINSR